jgi:hypothetical protein
VSGPVAGGRDSELRMYALSLYNSVCSRTGVSNWPGGDCYPAAERHANVLFEANRYWSATTDVSNSKQRYFVSSCRLNPCEDLNK